MTSRPWWTEPTRAQWTSFLAAWLGWVLDAFDFTIFLLVMPRIAKEFGVSTTAAAGSITLTLLVRLGGGIAAGAAADRWGRKLPLMIAMVWFALCDGAVALAPSFGWVLALRTLFGFGMGAEWTAGATLAMENWPERSRGIASGILQGSWAVGYFLAAVAAATIVPHFGWRGLFVVAAVPALLVLPIRAWVPESTEWRRGQALRQLPAAHRLVPRASFPVGRLIWGSVAMGAGFGLYYGMTGLWPTLLTELGRTDISRLVALFNIGMLAGAVAIGTLAARRGVLLALAVPIAATLLVLPLYVGRVPGLLALGALLGGAFGGGICGVTPYLLTSLFSSAIRARCVGLVYHAGALLAAFVPTVVAALRDHAGLPLGRSIALTSGTCAVLLLGMLPLIRLMGAPAEVTDWRAKAA